MYSIEYTNAFKRDYKLFLKRGYKEALIQHIITLLANGTQLPARTSLTNLQAIIKIVGNAIFNPIGY